MTSAAKAPLPSSTAEDRRFFGHPRGLATLFLVEMWERFSWYGFRAILVLYLTASAVNGGLGMAETVAVGLYSVYNALIYITPLAGGWFADRVLGARKSVLAGGAVIASGHFVLAIPLGLSSFYAGLLLIAVGTGLLKANASVVVGALYGRDDERRDSGFTIFYMAINIGALLGIGLVSYLGTKINWHLGFAAAGVGMVIGLIAYVIGQKHLHGVCDGPTKRLSAAERSSVLKKSALWAGIAVAALAADLLLGTFHIAHVINVLTLVAVALPVILFVMMFRDRELTSDHKRKVTAFVWFYLAAAVFFMIFEQAGSMLNLFAQQHVDRMIAGWQFPTGWFQWVNPAFILMLAPVFAAVWSTLGSRQPATVTKFGVSMLIIGSSFLVMCGAVAAAGAAADGRTTMFWLIGVYFMQTVAELLLSPVGLSLSTKLAPAKYSSQFMALWLLAVATGSAVTAQMVKLQDEFGTIGYYALAGGIAVLVGVALFATAGKVKQLTGDVR